MSPTPQALTDLVAYAEGSIVNHMLLKTECGSTTLYAFAKGEGFREHTAPFDALVLVIDGEAQIYVGGETVRVQTGETLLLPANVLHALHAERPFKMLLTMLRTPS
nr:hypothetical protein [uncultured bacterium]